jgi:hypothetical protein
MGLYEVEIDGELSSQNFDSWNQFIVAMKEGKCGLKNQLEQK